MPVPASPRDRTFLLVAATTVGLGDAARSSGCQADCLSSHLS